MSQAIIIGLAVLLTFSYAMLRGIATKATYLLGDRNLDRYIVYIWGGAASIAALFVKDNFVYHLPVVDRAIIFICLAILISNLVITKYSGYQPTGKFHVINFIVFYPIFEEVLFRGLLLPILNRSFQNTIIELAYLPVSLAVIISALLFAISHLQYYKFDKLCIRYMFFAFIGGLMFGAIADYTQSIVFSVLLHIAFNLLSAYYSKFQGNDR
ncbi:CPBP family intramembrane glutamic endopeptidase [Paenibacillus plantiphilus]|nr:CPBP family intramembrane glutamic endopeptidase [Paenibacillus plantiphilus]